MDFWENLLGLSQVADEMETDAKSHDFMAGYSAHDNMGGIVDRSADVRKEQQAAEEAREVAAAARGGLLSFLRQGGK